MQLVLPERFTLFPMEILYVSGPQVVNSAGTVQKSYGQQVVVAGVSDQKIPAVVCLGVVSLGEGLAYTVVEAGLKQYAENVFLPPMPARVEITESSIKAVKFDLQKRKVALINADRKVAQFVIEQPYSSIEIGWIYEDSLAPCRVFRCPVVKTRQGVSVFPSRTVLEG